MADIFQKLIIQISIIAKKNNKFTYFPRKWETHVKILRVWSPTLPEHKINTPMGLHTILHNIATRLYTSI